MAKSKQITFELNGNQILEGNNELPEVTIMAQFAFKITKICFRIKLIKMTQCVLSRIA